MTARQRGLAGLDMNWIPDIGIRPYYQDEWTVIFHADAREVLPLLTPGSVDLVVTSPPYNQADKIDRKRGRKARWHRMGNTSDWYEDDMPLDEYMAFQIETLELCPVVLKPDGSIMYNHKPDHIRRRVVHPLDWIRQLKELALVEELVWFRPGGIAFNAGLFVPFHENIYWLCRSDSKPRWPSREAMLWGSVWQMGYDREMPDVPCAFPIELPRRCISALTNPNEVVLDFFAGSGTTGRAAKDLGRRAILIEIKEAYCEIAARRMSQLALPL